MVCGDIYLPFFKFVISKLKINYHFNNYICTQIRVMIKKNIFSILIALIILYLSLSGSENYDKLSILNFPGADYIVHFLMYFTFMSVIVFEHRKEIHKTKILLLISIIPLFYGAIMELFQSWFTVSRTGSWSDLLFNFAGIIFSVIICLLIKSIRKELIR